MALLRVSDGATIAVHAMGRGRPLLLIHGFISDAATNWIKYGHAALLAEAGFRVLMPDLRGHGHSAKPLDPAAYPPDILATDMLDLVRGLGLSDYGLAGYSLGGRTVLRMLALGAEPRRAIIAGMGLEGIIGANDRRAHFRSVFEGLGTHPWGSAGWTVEAFLKTTGGDPVALNLLLDSFVDTDRALLSTLATPVAVICGEQDQDNGSAEALAAALPDGRYIPVPGTHMSAVAKAELGRAIRDYLLETAVSA